MTHAMKKNKMLASMIHKLSSPPHDIAFLNDVHTFSSMLEDFLDYIDVPRAHDCMLHIFKENVINE